MIMMIISIMIAKMMTLIKITMNIMISASSMAAQSGPRSQQIPCLATYVSKGPSITTGRLKQQKSSRHAKTCDNEYDYFDGCNGCILIILNHFGKSGPDLAIFLDKKHAISK